MAVEQTRLMWGGNCDLTGTHPCRHHFPRFCYRMHGDGTYTDQDGVAWSGQFYNGKFFNGKAYITLRS